MFAYASIRQHTQLHAGEGGLHDVFAFSHHRITVYCHHITILQYYNIIMFSHCYIANRKAGGLSYLSSVDDPIV